MEAVPRNNRMGRRFGTVAAATAKFRRKSAWRRKKPRTEGNGAGASSAFGGSVVSERNARFDGGRAARTVSEM